MNQPKHILIVEDDAVLQDVYKLVLATGGYVVQTADNGVDGLGKLKVFRPDLILLDIFMPKMDGREFLRNVDLTDYPDMRVVVYSNLSDKQTQSEMLELGAHDFIVKSSMTPSDLLDVVKRHLSI